MKITITSKTNIQDSASIKRRIGQIWSDNRRIEPIVSYLDNLAEHGSVSSKDFNDLLIYTVDSFLYPEYAHEVSEYTDNELISCYSGFTDTSVLADGVDKYSEIAFQEAVCNELENRGI